MSPQRRHYGVDTVLLSRIKGDTGKQQPSLTCAESMKHFGNNPALSAELKQFIDRCLVPLLVREFVAERQRQNSDAGLRVMINSPKKDELSAEVIQ